MRAPRLPLSSAPVARDARRPVVRAWLHVLRTYVMIDRLIEQQLRPFGLTHPQFGLLNELARSHGPTQQECSHALFTDKANLSGIVDRLGRMGMVERLADPADRRYNRVYLTARGREILGAANAEVEAILHEAFRPLTPEDQERLTTLLAKLQRPAE